VFPRRILLAVGQPAEASPAHGDRPHRRITATERPPEAVEPHHRGAADVERHAHGQVGDYPRWAGRRRAGRSPPRRSPTRISSGRAQGGATRGLRRPGSRNPRWRGWRSWPAPSATWPTRPWPPGREVGQRDLGGQEEIAQVFGRRGPPRRPDEPHDNQHDEAQLVGAASPDGPSGPETARRGQADEGRPHPERVAQADGDRRGGGGELGRHDDVHRRRPTAGGRSGKVGHRWVRVRWGRERSPSIHLRSLVRDADRGRAAPLSGVSQPGRIPPSAAPPRDVAKQAAGATIGRSGIEHRRGRGCARRPSATAAWWKTAPNQPQVIACWVGRASRRGSRAAAA